MAFRDEEVAARAQVEVLRGEIARLQRDNAALQKREAEPPRPSGLWPFATLALALLFGVAFALSRSPVVLAAAAATLMFAVFVRILMTGVLVVQPNEVVVISGRRHRDTDGVERGYRVVNGGRVFLMPVIESASRIPVGPHPLRIDLDRAYTREGSVAVALLGWVRLCTDDAIHGAVERFGGRDEAEIAEVAAQTIGGAAREVLAGLDASTVERRDPALIAAIERAAAADLRKLGLELQNLVYDF